MNSQTINVSLTKEEAQALLGLLDLAIKSGGLQVAGAGIRIAELVQTAASNSQPAE